MKTRLILPRTAVLSLAFSGGLYAQADWDAGALPDTAITNPVNWSGDTLPGAADNIRLGGGTSGAPALITVDQNFAFGTMFLGEGLGVAGNGFAELTMTAGTMTAQNIRLGTENITTGSGGGSGIFRLLSGTINLNETANVAQAMEIGRSTNSVGAFIMGDGTSMPVFNFLGGRFEVGNVGSSTATFTFNSGTVTGNDNFIIGQGSGTGSATAVIGGSPSPASFTTSADLNFNNMDAFLTISANGRVNVRDVNLMNNAAETSLITLSGGTLTVTDDMNDRAGVSILNLGSGHLEFTNPAAALREVDRFSMSGGTLSLPAGSVAGPVPLTVGPEAGDTGATGADITGGTLAIALQDQDNSAAVVTWTGGTAAWDTTGSRWDTGRTPARDVVIATGTTFPAITSTLAMTSQTLTSADPGTWAIVTPDANTISVQAQRDIALSPASAVLGSAGETVSRASGLQVATAIGADAASLTVNDGTLDLGTNLLTIGGTSGGVATQTGGTVNAGALDFGTGASTQGGTYNLKGGTLNIAGDITEQGGASVNNAQMLVDGGTLHVTGAINVQRFAVADTAGSTGSFALGAGRILTTSGTFVSGGQGTGTFTATDATVSTSDTAIADTTTGDGTVTLDGSTTWTNVTGKFRVSDAGVGRVNVLGSSQILSNGGNLEVAELATAVGTLTVNSTGGITLGNNNLVVGQTAGSDATLNLIQGTIDLRPAFVLNSGLGDMNVNAGTGRVSLTGGTLYAQDVNLTNSASGISTVTIDGGTLSIDGDLDMRDSGTDVVNLNSGVLDFDGPASAMHVANRTGSNTFNWTGGTLQGLVTYNGDLLQQGGILSPGNSPGQTTVTGDYTLGGTGIILLEVTSDGAGGALPGADFDQVLVNGTVSLAGNVTLSDLGGSLTDLADGTVLNLVHSDTGLTGVFANLPDGTTVALGGRNFAAQYTPNDFNLIAVPEPRTAALTLLPALILMFRR